MKENKTIKYLKKLDLKLKIKGKSMHIKKMAHFELLIEGLIIGVNYE